MSYLSSSCANYFLNSYTPELERKIAKNSLAEIGHTYTSGTVSLALTMNYLSSSYSHYFLNTYITNLIQN